MLESTSTSSNFFISFQLRISLGSTFPALAENESYVCAGTLFETELKLPLVQFGGNSYCNISAEDVPQNRHHEIGTSRQLIYCLVFLRLQVVWLDIVLPTATYVFIAIGRLC